MMKRKEATLSVVVVLLMMCGCKRFDNGGNGPVVTGSGTAKTEERPVEPFDAVEFTGLGRVVIVIGETHSLKITADDNILPLMLTEVTEGRLVIRPRQGIRPKVDLVVELTAEDIRSVASSGAGSLKLSGVDNQQLVIGVSGTGQVSASGKTEHLTLSVTGAADVYTHELEAAAASVEVTGTGKVEIHAKNSLEVAITGTGSVAYSGNPAVKKSIMGLGRVTKK